MTATAAHLREVTDETFAEEVLRSDVPVLVDFTADWCPPCRMVAPVLARIAEQRRDTLKVVSLDVDRNPRTQAAYGVLSMPTLVLFRDGEPARSVVGAQPERRLVEQLGLDEPR
ncbi:thioredoxin [Streptomyces qinglanensis]|uniref:Thioredoxin n=1 Tax=Streptomyces qinglanensis TaxID=943816 RepID=A0A1H9NYM6_9ACTN|nr:thioredoxin [Streptomyces qinglanensis]SER40917.1 thioredoxin 1 [Streptomyces qinglanensis]